MQNRIIVALLSLCFAAACAAAPADGDPEAITLPYVTACETLAIVRCERMSACTNGVMVAQLFGTRETCEHRMADACLLRALAPGADATAAHIDACMAATSESACVDLFADGPEACRPSPGTLAEGQSCAYDLQCASARCLRLLGSTCGACTSTGIPCGPTTCASPGVCVLGHCAIPIAGSAASGLAHHGGIEGLVPDPVPELVASVRTIEPGSIVVARPGEPCGLARPGAVCAEAGRCVRAPGSLSGVCVAAAPDGGRCYADPSHGPGCMIPARCQRAPGALTGTCVRPVAALCGP